MRYHDNRYNEYNLVSNLFCLKDLTGIWDHPFGFSAAENLQFQPTDKRPMIRQANFAIPMVKPPCLAPYSPCCQHLASILGPPRETLQHVPSTSLEVEISIQASS